MRRVLTAWVSAVLLATVLLGPPAAARELGQELLDASVSHDRTLPSTACPTCAGVSASAWVDPLPSCYDCPVYAAGAGAETDGSAVGVRAFVCYSAFVTVCLVDVHEERVLL